MIACAFGSGAAAFVEPTVRDLARFTQSRGVDLVGVNIERLTAPRSDVALVYVLPFETAPTSVPISSATETATALAAAFPNARIANPIVAHELCTDRVALSERLLERGIPVPESVVTDASEEAREFVRRCQHTVLRDVRAGRRGGGLVVVDDGTDTLAGEARGRRYALELRDDSTDYHLAHGVLECPPPFFLQRLITRVERHGVLAPAPVQRAYVVDERVVFWTEAYRQRAKRPSDFLVSPEDGARRRFIQVVSNEADKLVRRVAKVVGAPIAAVDIVRSDTGYVVLDVVTDGRYMMIDRSFKTLPEHREAFDLDRHIAATLVDLSA